MSVRLYVGNLPKETIDREALQAIYADLADKVTTKVIKDRKTGKCRGFAFVTVPDDATADQFIEKYNGYSFMEHELKIEKALPRKSKSEEGGAESSETRASKKKSKKKSHKSHSHSTQTGAVQPDPRWASELAKLKEMLAAQTANS